MKKLVVVFLVSGLVFGCHKREVEPGCDTLATVTDLTKTTGCGFGFTLANGKVLVAGQHNSKCGHHNDVLANFQWADGLKVKIGYEIEDHLSSACKAGTVVEITCIQIVTTPVKE
jgi:hypothetical protein